MAGKQAVFRCDSTPSLGGGHLMRCLTLADALKERGWQSFFILTEETLRTTDLALRRGYRSIVDRDLAPHCNVMVIDHYELNTEAEINLARNADTLMIIDDIPSRIHKADILLDHTYGRNTEDYAAYIPKKCECLLGSNYALVRPEFHRLRPHALKKRQGFNAIKRIIIFTTSVDAFGITEHILKALEKISISLSIDLVLHRSSRDYNIILQYVDRSRHHYKIHSDSPDMAELMLHADLAIGAGGTASWERCVMALPTIIINLADNQASVIKNLEGAGAVISVGKYSETGFTQRLQNALADVLQWSPKDYIHKAEIAASICDGQGAARVADFLAGYKKDKL